MKQEPYNIQPYPFDDFIINEAREKNEPVLAVYPCKETVVVLGRGSDPDVEVFVDRCREDGVPLLRRHGGGCAVVLDPGNLVVSVAIPVEGLTRTKEYFQKCTDWMIEGLTQCGIEEVYYDGVSDLVIGEKKIAGSCVYRMKNWFYYSVSLLVTPDIPLMMDYLKHPPREPEYRRGRPHDEFVTGLAEVDGSLTVEGLVDRLKNVLVLEQIL